MNIPNLDNLYDEVATYVKEHQGEKGYIDCQPYKKENGDCDTIYTFEFNELSGWGEERVVYGVRWNEEEKDLEICFEPYVRSFRTIYDEKTFKGEYEGEDKDANAEWYPVRWSDIIYFVPTIFSIAESIEEYA